MFKHILGASGIALLHLRLGNDKAAYEIMTKVLQRANGRSGCSFLCEEAGIWAVAAVAFYRDDPNDDALPMALQKTINCFQYCGKDDVSDELLYGRVGYLYTLQYLRHHLPPDILGKEISSLAKKTVNLILESGLSSSRFRTSPDSPPLYYQWHGKIYLGAAHGISGILSIILREYRIFHQYDKELLDPEHLKAIEETIDWLIEQTNIKGEGNLPSRFQNSSKMKLIQFCHGNPGFIFCLTEGCKVFPARREEWMGIAEEAGEVVWERGLLKKGVGLCHGISGNGFALLSLFDLTRDEKWLNGSQEFATIALESIKAEKDHQLSTPDHPYSLYEGMAGLAWLIDDLVKGVHGGFPAFTDT